MLPRVTVIIANYNYDQYISDAIQSAIDQDYEGPLSICIIDDGSTDNSWKEISKFFSDTVESEYINDMKVIRGVSGKIDLVGLKTRNGGASVARNTGIDVCMEKTEVYAILEREVRLNWGTL